MLQYPIFLYIKQHVLTKKLYFGKTTNSDPTKYKGSGLHWSRHLKVHGSEVDTLWFCLFTSQEDCTNFALSFSEQENIVGSKDWLNMKPENGLDGTPKGTKLSIETRKKISLANIGKTLSGETRAKISKQVSGRNLSDDHKKKLSMIALNLTPEKRANQIESTKIKSDETKQKMKTAALNRDLLHNKKIGAAHLGIHKSEMQKHLISESLKAIPKIKCKYCQTICSPSNIKRWHDSKCRKKSTEGALGI
jgi:hypothetical protein